MEIVLASQSPRRSEILKNLGISFTVCTSKNKEVMPQGLSPADTVMALAREKGRGIEGNVVLSADTIVVYNGQILGKPKNEEDAATMLRLLSGKTHEVYTGLCINGKCDYDVAKVTFAPLTEEEIAKYIKTKEPMDKAGAYGAQGIGGCFVERIEGDFFTVMGLPVHKLYEMLKSIGVAII